MTSIHRLLPAAAALLSLTPAFAQAPPTPVEARMIASIDRNAEANVAFLRQLVEINSGTMNLAGVQAVADSSRRDLRLFLSLLVLHTIGYTTDRRPTHR